MPFNLVVADKAIFPCLFFSSPLFSEAFNISILYGWSGICGQPRLCSCVFSPVTSSKLIIIFNFYFGELRRCSLAPIIIRICCYSLRRLYSLIILVLFYYFSVDHGLFCALWFLVNMIIICEIVIHLWSKGFSFSIIFPFNLYFICPITLFFLIARV